MSVIGIIGGSGLYALDGLEDMRTEPVESPFGAPSDVIIRGRLGTAELAFLPRHGRGHTKSPSEINYRANIDCLKRLGVTDILSLSACGSLREEMAPGDFVIVDQFIDRTRMRPSSFFGDGVVAHVSMAEPTCTRLARAAKATLGELDIAHHPRGTYLVMEGPQFSTRAESELYRQWGADLIGMTNLPEAKLAREAEICYLTIGMVTDYDCWNAEHAAVEVENVLAVLQQNSEKAKALISSAAPAIAASRPEACRAGCDRALETAIVTPPGAWDTTATTRLGAVAGRLFSGSSNGAKETEKGEAGA